MPHSGVWLARARTPIQGAYALPCLFFLPLAYFPCTATSKTLTRPCAQIFDDSRGGDIDLRMTYCAFVVCALLGDWSSIDLLRAPSNIQRCRVRVSIPSSFLSSLRPKTLIRNTHTHARTRRTKADTDRSQRASRSAGRRTARSRRCTSSQRITHVRPRRAYDAAVRWLLHTEAESCGGFAGLTNKLVDVCYGFWCGAALALRTHLSTALPHCVACENSLAAPMGRPTWPPGSL